MTISAIVIIILGLVALNRIFKTKTLNFKIIASTFFVVLCGALYLSFVVIMWNSSKDPRELRLKEYEREQVDVKQNVNWEGQYSFNALNKDGLITSFEITIADINNILLVYISDSGKPETYKNLKAQVLQTDQIKIIFNKEYGDMGAITLEKSNNEFMISGQPIYYINPGNNTRIIKKIM
ncbi:MAG: hypothetical protein WKF66_20905 [Pedobacter sp.]